MALQTDIERSASEGEPGMVLDFSGEDETTEETTEEVEDSGEDGDESDDEDPFQTASDDDDEDDSSDELPLFGLDLGEEKSDSVDEDEEGEIADPFAALEDESDQDEEDEQESDEREADEKPVSRETFLQRLGEQREKYKTRLRKKDDEIAALQGKVESAPSASPIHGLADKLYGEYKDPATELRFDNLAVTILMEEAKRDPTVAEAWKKVSDIMQGRPEMTEKTETVETPEEKSPETKPDAQVIAMVNATRNQQVKGYLEDHPIDKRFVESLRKEMVSFLKEEGVPIDEITKEHLALAGKNALKRLNWDADFVMEKKKPAKKNAKPSTRAGGGRAAASTKGDKKAASGDKEKGEEPPKNAREWQDRRRREVDDFFVSRP